MGDLVAALIIVVLLAIAWLALTEFSYLSPRVTYWVYQFGARSFDRKARRPAYTSPRFQSQLLAPLQRQLAHDPNARVLDLACGTGRASMLLLAQSWFLGTITAIDFSSEMLDVFSEKLSGNTEFAARVVVRPLDLSLWNAERGSEFDAAMLMESCEFLPDSRRVLAEIEKSLACRGVLVLTKPPDWLAWLFFGRGQSRRQITHTLLDLGFDNVEFQRWRWRYEIVIAQLHRRSENGMTPGDV
jgi:SAM-dependent methyltransferase